MAEEQQKKKGGTPPPPPPPPPKRLLREGEGDSKQEKRENNVQRSIKATATPTATSADAAGKR